MNLKVEAVEGVFGVRRGFDQIRRPVVVSQAMWATEMENRPTGWQ